LVIIYSNIISAKLLLFVGVWTKKWHFWFCDAWACVPTAIGMRLAFFSMTANGLPLAEVGDFGAQNCQYTTKVDAR